ncbi:MAG: sigma-70 family RNA polymerase sigma factor [Blastocatellia bacterium]|nr:sigma-70 family RNA polymerase sigma factor [Blastocatellia bacterium]
MTQGQIDREFAAAALDHLDALYGYATALTRDRMAAEDLVQETYLRAVRAFGRLLPDSNLKGWLFAIIAQRLAQSAAARVRTGPAFIELDAEDDDRWRLLESGGASPLAELEQSETRVRVRAAIESLPPAFREIVILRDIEGFSYQQIATIIGCPAGTVMSRLGRARDRLRLLLVDRRQGVAT